MSSILYEPFYDFDRFFDDAMNSRFGPRSTDTSVQHRGNSNTDSGAIRALKPRMDLEENNENNSVTATFELPGPKKDDVQIDDVHNNRLNVSGERKQDSERTEGNYAIREHRYAELSSSLRVSSDIKAKLSDGVLNVNFPKASAEMAPKKITIN